MTRRPDRHVFRTAGRRMIGKQDKSRQKSWHETCFDVGGGNNMSHAKNKRKSVLILIMALCMAMPATSQQPPQKEYVQVVNVELILRVLKDGSPVGGLQKKDFTLYEDGEKREINGFFEIHRRIAPAAEGKKQALPARLYLLFFWVGNPAVDVAGVLDKFFSEIYRDGDRVLLSTALNTFDIRSRQDVEMKKSEFLDQWRQEAKKRHAERSQFIDDLNRLLETYVIGVVGKSAALQMKGIDSLLMQYAAAVQEYQLRELTPDMDALGAMARSLIPVSSEKYALVFFQRDTLPLFDVSRVGDHCLLNGIRNEAIVSLKDSMQKIEFQAKTVFNSSRYSEELKTLFIQANTQFHLLFLSPERNDDATHASHSLALTKSEELFSSWDWVMQKISKSTGGSILAGDRLLDVLDQVVALEDIYYHITYVPGKAGSGKRQIDVRVEPAGMEIIHGRMLELQDLPRVKITGVSASGQQLRLEIADFYPIVKQGIPTGLVNVYVTGKQTDNEPPRLLVSQGSETAGKIELNVSFPQPGPWHLQVRAIDQITGEQAVKNALVEIGTDAPPSVAGRAGDPRLSALLAKGAAYAEKLKKAAFHFFCREEVQQEIFGIDETSVLDTIAKSYWIYDYQIVGQDGKISENRLLLEKNRKKMRREKAQLETVFRSFYSFYMPVTFLAREKQDLYHYRLLGRERVFRRPAWRVAVVRRDPSRPIPWGEVWVSEEDGAVLRIQVDQTSIVGFDKLAEKLEKHGYEPTVTTIHEFGLEKNRIRFPSKTVFIERYKSERDEKKDWSGRSKGKTEAIRYSFERSRTYFEYSDHHFFSVMTSVEERGE
jgi:hypothetical protein